MKYKEDNPKGKIFQMLFLLLAGLFLAGCNGQETSAPEIPISQQPQNEEREPDIPVGENKDEKDEDSFPIIQVEDDGRELPANAEYQGPVCNIKESGSENRLIQQPDGSGKAEPLTNWKINNISFCIPDDKIRSRAFGVPIFSTEIYADGQMETIGEWHYVTGRDCPEFNDGMEETRELILEGYFQKPLELFMSKYPELDPAEREYTLRLTGGGRTDRERDNTSWWDLYYMLFTTLDNGEVIAVASIDITKIIQAQGLAPVDDAYCRIWTCESNYWRILENPFGDLGRVWVNQLPEKDFSQEEEIRAYVEEQGAAFDCLLPAGADRKVDWSCRKEQGYWYDYLIWTGNTDTYALTLAIPIMEEGAGGWYLASRIRKEAVNKEPCQHTLSVMMQTFHAIPYIHIVEEGENLWSIYSRYVEEEKGWWGGYPFMDFINYNDVENPDLIYPGKYIKFPWLRN